MHAVRHQYSLQQVTTIAAALDAAGVDSIEVAHGDGLAGSSCIYGFGADTDLEWIEAVADVCTRPRSQPWYCRASGRCATSRTRTAPVPASCASPPHCTEADISAQHMAAARELGMDAVGFLMMSHMTTPPRWPSRRS